MIVSRIWKDNKLILGPMAGITDHAFRQICREEGCGLVYSEMINARGLLELSEDELKDIGYFLSKDKPISVQVFGSDPDVISKAGKIAQDYFKADIVDFNMGCPARKILKNKEGGWLMRDPSLAFNITESLVKNLQVPVTIKIRKGWEDCLTALEISKKAEEVGVQAIAVHGRLVEQGFSGEADWDIIKQIGEEVEIPVLGNGDVFTPELSQKMLDYCNCSAVMIARGAMGNPWIFSRAQSLIEKGIKVPSPTLEERMEKALRHLDLLIEHKGENRGIKEMRKHAHWYVKAIKGAVAIRSKINKASSREEFVSLFDEILSRQSINIEG